MSVSLTVCLSLVAFVVPFDDAAFADVDAMPPAKASAAATAMAPSVCFMISSSHSYALAK